MSNHSSSQKESIALAKNKVTIEIDIVFTWIKIQSKHDTSNHCLKYWVAEDFLTEVDSNCNIYHLESDIDNQYLAITTYGYDNISVI